MGCRMRLSVHARGIVLGVVALVCFIALLFWPPFPQDTTYHNFADQRTLWNVPHALNVLSNLPFVVFGIWGLVGLMQSRDARHISSLERFSFFLLFAFVTLTGVGSMYYHAQPRNDTLFWDRLPLTVVFMTFYCLVLADRIDWRLAGWLIAPLVLLGVFSVSYWHWTEMQGEGDVRIYAYVQFFPLLTLPFIFLFFPEGRYRTADLLGVIAWYAFAKLLEWLDGEIYGATSIVSGHTLKHLAASLGAFWVWVMLRHRLRLSPPVGRASQPDQLVP